MSRYEKLLAQIMRGASDASISFEGLCQLLRNFGFEERVKGSHHIFTKAGVTEILNLQPQGHLLNPIRSNKYVISS